jgi:hypothetical protein
MQSLVNHGYLYLPVEATQKMATGEQETATGLNYAGISLTTQKSRKDCAHQGQASKGRMLEGLRAGCAGEELCRFINLDGDNHILFKHDYELFRLIPSER